MLPPDQYLPLVIKVVVEALIAGFVLRVLGRL
jgi:hypothetical protein